MARLRWFAGHAIAGRRSPQRRRLRPLVVDSADAVEAVVLAAVVASADPVALADRVVLLPAPADSPYFQSFDIRPDGVH